MSAISLQALQLVGAQFVQEEDDGGNSGRSRVSQEKLAILEAEGTAETQYEEIVTQQAAYATGFELGTTEAANATVVITGSRERQTLVTKFACTFRDPRAQVVTNDSNRIQQSTSISVYSSAFPSCKTTRVLELRPVLVKESDPAVLEGLIVYFSQEDPAFLAGIVDGWAEGRNVYHVEFSPANEAFIKSVPRQPLIQSVNSLFPYTPPMQLPPQGRFGPYKKGL